MYDEEMRFGKLFLKQFDMVLEHLTLVTLTFDQGHWVKCSKTISDCLNNNFPK